jgi:hypothetical protein
MRAAAARVERAENADAANEPSVTYDLEARQVFATVFATPAVEPGTFNVVAPPISLFRQEWTVFWDLISTDAPAEFSAVDLPADPLQSGKVMVSDSGLVSPTQWSAKIDNRVANFNGFNYFIQVVPLGQLEPLTRHDPSISVVPDPPPGG